MRVGGDKVAERRKRAWWEIRAWIVLLGTDCLLHLVSFLVSTRVIDNTPVNDDNRETMIINEERTEGWKASLPSEGPLHRGWLRGNVGGGALTLDLVFVWGVVSTVERGESQKNNFFQSSG